MKNLFKFESLKKFPLKVGLIASLLIGTVPESIHATEYEELFKHHTETLNKNRQIQDSLKIETGEIKKGTIKDDNSHIDYNMSFEKNVITNTVVLKNKELYKTIYQDGYTEVVSMSQSHVHKPDGELESVSINFPTGETLRMVNHHTKDHHTDSIDVNGVMTPISDLLIDNSNIQEEGIRYEITYPNKNVTTESVKKLEQQLKTDHRLLKAMFAAQTVEYAKLLEKVQKDINK